MHRDPTEQDNGVCQRAGFFVGSADLVEKVGDRRPGYCRQVDW